MASTIDKFQKWQKIFFLILKIWLITFEGIQPDTLDLTQVLIFWIQFFQTQKQDHKKDRLECRNKVPPEVDRKWTGCMK